MTADVFRVSPLDREYETDRGRSKMWQIELRDLARGFCGGLIVALPLLYTMEMWTRARFIPGGELAGILVAAYFINVAACYFCGFKNRHRRVQPWFDALTSMGIGTVAALCTLLLIGRMNPSTPPHLVVSLLTLELIPVSLGASLAMNQLGGGGGSGSDGVEWGNADIRTMLATMLGAILFAFNVAPTIEPKVILTTVSLWHIVGLAAFSLFVSWLMVEFAQFTSGSKNKGKIFCDVWVETALSYLISLLVSASFLWMFGYISLGTDWETIVPWVIVLGYATTLGGSAGRLIL